MAGGSRLPHSELSFQRIEDLVIERVQAHFRKKKRRPVWLEALRGKVPCPRRFRSLTESPRRSRTLRPKETILVPWSIPTLGTVREVNHPGSLFRNCQKRPVCATALGQDNRVHN